MCKLNPKVDFAFKKLFGSEENKDILLAFINSVLESGCLKSNKPFNKIATIILKNPYNLTSFKTERGTIVDVKAQDENGTWYDIEIQNNSQKYFAKRALYYWAKIYSDQIPTTKIFDELRKTISINILNFNLIDEPDFHNLYLIRNAESNNELLDEMFEMHFIECGKFDKELEHLKTALERWITFLNKAASYEKGKIPEQLAIDPGVKKAIETLDVMSNSEEEREAYNDSLKLLMIRDGELKTAKLEGKTEEKYEIARNMIEEKYSNDTIAKLTKLSTAEIEKLRH